MACQEHKDYKYLQLLTTMTDPAKLSAETPVRTTEGNLLGRNAETPVRMTEGG